NPLAFELRGEHRFARAGREDFSICERQQPGEQFPFAVPNLDNAVVGTGEESLRIRCHGEALEGSPGFAELAFLPGFRALPSRVRFGFFVSEHSTGIRAGDDKLSTPRPGNGRDRGRMLAETARDMAGFDVPNLELFVRPAAGDLCGIGVEGGGE